METTNKSRNIINFLVRTAIFGTMSIILYVVPIFQFKLPIFLPFLEIHLDEVPAFIAGFAYGPFCGAAVLLLRTIVKLPMTSSLCVGELADLIYSLAFILPATFIYKKMRNWKGVSLGLTIGTLSQLIISMIIGIYLIFPFYCNIYGISTEQLLSMCKGLNPLISDVEWTMGLFMILPFNAIKDAIVVLLTLVLYKSLSKLINKLDANKKLSN